MRFFTLLLRGAQSFPLAVRNGFKHGFTGEAARLAYFFFLSLFPLLLVLFALSGYFGGAASFHALIRAVEDLVPQESAPMLDRFASKLASERRPDVLSVGLALAAWSASGVFAALSEALNRIHGATHESGWLRRRLRAILLLAVVCALLAVAATGLLLLPSLLGVVGAAGLGNTAAGPVVFLLLAATLFLVFYLLPDRDLARQRMETAVGALFGTALLFLAAWGFRRYVHRIANFSAVYGVVAGAILLLIWMYVAALMILLAAELGAAISGGRKKAK
ncbi:MAG: YihY/virulence factor BrkB family protein [Acidobacteriota bacterium]